MLLPHPPLPLFLLPRRPQLLNNKILFLFYWQRALLYTNGSQHVMWLYSRDTLLRYILVGHAYRMCI
jgi:hypothetical protein